MLSRERWERLEPILGPALELGSEELAEYLDRVCRGEPGLRADLEFLLRAVRQAGRALEILDSPAAELAAPLLQLELQALEAARELAPGEVVGAYEVERRLGSGGMGVVYLGHDRRLKRRVALKLPPAWLPPADAANRRLIREAQAASTLDHPNIQAVYEVGETADGRPYIAMAHYEGETLQARIARGPLPLDAAIDIARQIADGLAAAHARNIVHRDIKPGNVIVTPDGVVKIVDFGVASIASQELMLPDGARGTVAYMSPEQARGAPVDARTDLWSLGVVLYEMIAGERPFRGEDREALLLAIRQEVPEPIERLRPDVPLPLARVIGQCLAREPDRRYQTAAELRGDLASLQRASGTRSGRWVRTRAGATVAVAAFAALLVAIDVLRPPVAGPAQAIAVFPPRPLGTDSLLQRLGRELAVTLARNLDGMAGIRTVPASTMLAQGEDDSMGVGQAARRARRLGASSFLDGTLLRSDGLARMDLTLFTAADVKPIAHASVTAPASDIVGLTDQATIELLRQVWSRGEPPVPNLAAVTTTSVPALRAYLEGELAFARADFDDAVVAFRRAFAADSAFDLAYWRSLYPSLYEGSGPDPDILARLLARRDRLPEPERLLAEAYAAPTLRERLGALRALTTRFVGYGPGWYDYANRLVHDGPYIGFTYADARWALDQVLALHPGFAPAWVHRLIIAALQRDSMAANRAIANLERLSAPDGFWVNPDNMTFAYAIRELLRSGGEFPAGSALPGRLARLAVQPTPVPHENLALRLLLYGFPKGSLAQVDAALQGRLPPDVEGVLWKARAQLWAARGAWDSSLVALDEWLRLSVDDVRAPLLAYGLAVLGVTAGEVPSATARRWRPRLATGLSGGDSAEWSAERAWLDGIAAHADGDPGAITRAIGEVEASGAPHAALLGRSLRAFLLDARGHRGKAARALADLEWAAADQGLHLSAAAFHPYLAAVHRPAAAGWLLATGERRDSLEAARLLTWHEAIQRSGPAGLGAANRIVEPLALLERARIEEAWSRDPGAGAARWREAARAHYRGFLERYDRPSPRAAPRVSGALAGIAALGTTN